MQIKQKYSANFKSQLEVSRYQEDSKNYWVIKIALNIYVRKT